jgi:hypothetical protein
MSVIQATRYLRLPATVNGSAAKLLTLLERDHGPPFLLVDCIDVPACLNAHAASGSSSRQAIHLRDVDEFACVELECRLGTECLEVNLSVGVVQADKLVKRLGARIELDTGWIVVDNEAVVGLGGFSTEGKLFVCVELRVGLDGSCGDSAVVDDLVEVAGQRHAGALDRRTTRDVEVANPE